LDFELSEEHRMIKDLVARFVDDELIPLEGDVLTREANGQGLGLSEAEHRRIDEASKSLGLWGLDAPTDIGGSDLAQVAMVAVN
jgi:acyl-CoA dehydrogenase